MQLFSLLLVTLWLPATLHCQLEAAGLGESHHDDCCPEQSAPTGTDCLGDACANIETSLIKESAPDLNLAAPVGHHLFCGIAPAILRAALVAPALSPTGHAPPLELKVTWQFVERAAPPARAPSLHS